MLKALSLSVGFAFVAHSPSLSAAILPALGAAVAVLSLNVVCSLSRRRMPR